MQVSALIQYYIIAMILCAIVLILPTFVLQLSIDKKSSLILFCFQPILCLVEISNTKKMLTQIMLLCYSTQHERQEISRPVACNSCPLIYPICVLLREITHFNSFCGFGFVLIFLNYKRDIHCLWSKHICCSGIFSSYPKLGF